MRLKGGDKYILIKMDLFTALFMPQKTDDGSMFSYCFINSGSLRMSETTKSGLVATFFFALSKHENPPPTEEKSVTESS